LTQVKVPDGLGAERKKLRFFYLFAKGAGEARVNVLTHSRARHAFDPGMSALGH
jgi:hypothetical protein